MKSPIDMSINELFEYRNKVWEAYYVSVINKDTSGVEKYAEELESIDKFLYKRIHE